MADKVLVTVVGSLEHKLEHQEKWPASFAAVFS